MADEQISLPSLIVLVVLAGLVIRYLFFSPVPQVQQPRDAASASRNREAAVERIQQMFPQYDRRTILWDLQRNGGNVTLTTERILAGRVEPPPVTFQPPPSSVPSPSPSSSSQAQTPQKPAPKPAEPDLITRYKLQNKITGDSAEESGDGSSKGWSSNREERQSALQRRRDEMILAARKKMEAKIAAEKVGGSS